MWCLRVPVIVIVILRDGSRERLLKYINVGDKSTMVARLPQQVFLLLVLVTGTTMGVKTELPKSTRSSTPRGIREDRRPAGRSSEEMPHSGFSISKDGSLNFESRSFDTEDRVVGRKLHENELKYLANDHQPSTLTKRRKVESSSVKEERQARRRAKAARRQVKRSLSKINDLFEHPESLRARRSSGSLLFSTSSGTSAWNDAPSTLSAPPNVEVAAVERDAKARTRPTLPSSNESNSTELGTLGPPDNSKKLQTTGLAARVEPSHARWRFNGDHYETTRDSEWLTGFRAALPATTLSLTTAFAFSKRYTRDASDSNKCEKFEIGDVAKREFYSPNYPQKYPPLANCVLVLEAEKGMLLKVDFREVFELETETPNGECRYDYLEVRDGQYGFSPKIGKYCDMTFPPEIISQSRYLWLNFHSDDTIEYQGFKAVWTTVPRPNTDAIPAEQDPCIYHEDIPSDFELKSDMIKDAKKVAETNRVALDCLWVMKAGESMKMQLTFDSFKLEKPNDCSANFLDVFDGQTDEPSRVKKFCGSIAESLSTKSNTMYIRLYLEQKAINSSFSALITAVRDKDSNQPCKDNEYDCDDATCIAAILKCNKRRNCRFQRDEDDTLCGTSFEKQDRSRIVIILVIFSLIMFGMCTAFVFNCVRKLRRDHRIIREHIRQSREDRLDEIGRRATPCPLSVSRTDLRDGASESPVGEEVDSSKELIPAATLSAREYTKELALQMKYGSKEINDIHQSNNVSNATQERLQESSEEPDMCDSSCQTRESLFAPGFLTFGYPNVVEPPPVPEDCSRDSCPQICPQHNPIPAPPGWSLHDPPFPHVLPDGTAGARSSGDAENSTYRRYRSPKPDREPTIPPSIYHEHRCRYPPAVTRQNTVGSGERYGSFIYGSGRASSNTASSNATNISTTSSSTTTTSTATDSKHSRPYRAEAVIELDQKRPFSIESTKSAPDVIATH